MITRVRAAASHWLAGVLVGGLGLSVAGAQLGDLVHHLSVRHAVCPEHGELIDVHLAHPAAASSGTSGPQVAAGVGSEEDHDHCGFSCTPRGRPAVAVVGGFVGLLPGQEGVAPGLPAARPPIPTLRLAPKSSPPGA